MYGICSRSLARFRSPNARKRSTICRSIVPLQNRSLSDSSRQVRLPKRTVKASECFRRTRQIQKRSPAAAMFGMRAQAVGYHECSRRMRSSPVAALSSARRKVAAIRSFDRTTRSPSINRRLESVRVTDLHVSLVQSLRVYKPAESIPASVAGLWRQSRFQNA